MHELFHELEKINTKPKPFEFYTAKELWTDEHTSNEMLAFHLNDEIDAASRNSVFIERSVEWITSQFGVRSGTKVADFGCGPGLYTIRLAERGASVTGIDFSARSLEHARSEVAGLGLKIEYLHDDYLDCTLDGQFDLVLMIMCDFCTLSRSQRKTLLLEFQRVLDTDGYLLLDVLSTAAYEQRQENARYELNLFDSFWSAEPYYGFRKTFKYESEKVVLDKYTIVERNRVRTIYNWLQHFTPEMLKQEFADCGLRVESLFADVAGSPYSATNQEFAVVARRQ